MYEYEFTEEAVLGYAGEAKHGGGIGDSEGFVEEGATFVPEGRKFKNSRLGAIHRPRPTRAERRQKTQWEKLQQMKKEKEAKRKADKETREKVCKSGDSIFNNLIKRNDGTVCSYPCGRANSLH